MLRVLGKPIISVPLLNPNQISCMILMRKLVEKLSLDEDTSIMADMDKIEELIQNAKTMKSDHYNSYECRANPGAHLYVEVKPEGD